MNNNLPNDVISITHPGKYTVYRHEFPDRPGYVGQTNKTMEERLKEGYGNNPELEKALEGPHETIVLMEGLSSRHADARERLYIAKYGTMLNVGGFNHQTGGKKDYEVLRRDSQPVIATNVKTGEERRFSSVAWASKATKVQANHIYENMNGIRKSIGGYEFRRAEKQ